MNDPYPLPDQRRAEAQWRNHFCGTSDGELITPFACELAEYLSAPFDEIIERMRRAEAEFAELWKQRGVDPNNPDDLNAFYNAGMVEAFELMYWHAGGQGRCPIQAVFASWLATALGARNVIDYGSGVGSSAVFFGRNGFAVDLADVSEPLLKFARWRMQQRGLRCEGYWLPHETPPAGHYDLALCFDVAEHVPDPAALVDDIARHLRTGGVLVATLYENSDNPKHPMHVSSCGPITDFARKTSMWIDWHLTEQLRRWGGWCIALRKRPAGRLLRSAEHFLDGLSNLRGALTTLPPFTAFSAQSAESHGQ